MQKYVPNNVTNVKLANIFVSKRFVTFMLFMLPALIIASFGAYLPILAQDTTSALTSDQPAEIKDFEGLRADFKQETQDPESKNVTFNMVLHSNINSDRVKIEWTVTGVSKLVNNNQKRVDLDIRQGQSYTIPITVQPTGEGITEVYGTAQSVSVDSSFLVTVRKNFGSNTAGEVLPLTQEYQTAKTLSSIKNVVLVVAGIAILVFALLIGFRKLVRYLKAPPEIEYPEEIPDYELPKKATPPRA